jgi:chaperonin GroES
VFPNKQSKKETIRMKIKPLGDRVLVQAIELEEQVKGGIIIPDSAKEKPQEATVIAIGPGKRDDDGKLIPMEVKVGDTVLTSKYGGTDIRIDDQEYKILNSSDILAIVEK